MFYSNRCYNSRINENNMQSVCEEAILMKNLTRFASIALVAAAALASAPGPANAYDVPAACDIDPAIYAGKVNSWVFVANFPKGDERMACIIAIDPVGYPTFNPVPCEVAGNVTFDQGWARFSGDGMVVCPFDLNAYMKQLPPQTKTDTFLMLATTSDLKESALAKGNPIWSHPSAGLYAPVQPSHKLEMTTRYNGVLYNTPTPNSMIIAPGGTLQLRSQQYFGELIHSVWGKPIGHVSAPSLVFDNKPAKVTIGYDDVIGSFLTGNIDQIIVDPQAGKGG